MKFTINKEKLLLFLVLVLAFVLRIYKVSEFPAGLNADEAAIGYNAYSLLQTGKDEFGHLWPINFQSFNDFKPGLYFYLVLPFVKLLGLTELAVRLPSVILGTLTVGILYLLVKKLFNSSLFALSSSLLLAVSPWHLHFSRGGWESNAAVFFILLGVYLFFLSLEKSKYFTLSALSFSLSMFTYHSARVISPLLLAGLAIFNWKKIFVRKNTKSLIIAFVLAFLLMIPLLLSFFGEAGTSRFSGVGIFADQGPFWRVNELRGQHANPFGLFPRLLHNQYFEYLILFFYNLLSHYSGGFLFVFGDEIQRNKIPGMGQMYPVEIPFLILGLYFLIKNKPKNWEFLLYWLAVAPTASALTFQSPHAIRALNMVIPLTIICAYGLVSVYDWLKEKIKNFSSVVYRFLFLVFCFLFFVSYCWNFSFYLHQYYVHYHQTYPAAWEDGFKKLVEYVFVNEDRFEK
ncbi:glycosyltransferase family 39 protein, partial [Patescibacteria group bacterium]|nr:glycosyltransferase family 39 protein [Patescibacteria group bacterium]